MLDQVAKSGLFGQVLAGELSQVVEGAGYVLITLVSSNSVGFLLDATTSIEPGMLEGLSCIDSIGFLAKNALNEILGLI